MSDHDDRHEDLERAIITVGAQVSNALLQVAKSGHEIALALKALAPPAPDPKKATKLTLQYTLKGGNKIMGVRITNGIVGQVYAATVVESNATTPSIQPIGPLLFTSDNPAVVAVDPISGDVTLVSPGSANVTCMDTGTTPTQLTDTVGFDVSSAPIPVADHLDLEYALKASKRGKK